ncbi:MAG: hypothetical protein WC959_03845 [Kiritimatiellales bacterium]
MMRMLPVLLLSGLSLAGQSVFNLAPEMRRVETEATLSSAGWLQETAAIRAGFSIEPETPFNWIFSPGETVQLRCTSGNIQRGELHLTVWDWNGIPVAKKTLRCPVDETLIFNITGRGTWLLTLDQVENGTVAARLPKSFAVLPSNEAQRSRWSMDGEFFLGSCMFPARLNGKNSFGPFCPAPLTADETVNKELELDARLGLSIERISCSALVDSNRKSGGFPVDYSAQDQLVDLIAGKGFQVALQLGGLPWMQRAGNSGAAAWWQLPPETECFRRFAGEFLSRYAKHAAFVEVMNEPDNDHFWRGTADEYIEIFQIAAEESRKLSRPVKLLCGGLTPLAAPDDLIKQEKTTGILTAALDSPFIPFHAHGDLTRIRTHYENLNAIAERAGAKNISFIQTEGGDAAWRLDKEISQAVTHMQKLFFGRANGAEGWLFYATRWQGGPRMQIPPADGGTPAGWGYLDYYFCPRFAYGAIGAFADVYAGARFERKLAETEDLFVYEFSRGNDRLIAFFTLFQTRAGGTKKNISFKADAGGIQLLDAMGNVVRTFSAGTAAVTASAYPQTLIFKNASTINLQESK